MSWSSKRGSEERTTAEKRAYFCDHRPYDISIAQECRPMGIARSTFYDRLVQSADDRAIVEAMFAIGDDFELYGYRRVSAALRQQGIVVSHKKIR